FRHDDSFDAASHMDHLFADPRIQADLAASDDENEQ
ncbi:30S ribosome-binding factor RbfA, partial [Escherichia coli]|nr:30S ribosome-binding factor RbfA [Escherichia coli]